MSNQSLEAIPILVSIISITGLAVFFFFFWLNYRVDRLRDSLFTLRDKLFALGMSGEISFDSPSYGMLRRIINGLIRNAHRIELLNLLVFIVFTRRDEQMAKYAHSFEGCWEEALLSIGPEQRKKLQAIRTTAHFLAFEQLILVSPVLLLLILPVIAWILLRVLGSTAYQWVRGLVGNDRIKRFANQLDCAASLSADEAA